MANEHPHKTVAVTALAVAHSDQEEFPIVFAQTDAGLWCLRTPRGGVAAWSLMPDLGEAVAAHEAAEKEAKEKAAKEKAALEAAEKEAAAKAKAAEHHDPHAPQKK